MGVVGDVHVLLGPSRKDRDAILEDWPMQSGSILNGLATYIQHVDAHLIHHLDSHTRWEGLLVGRHGG